MSPYQRNMCHSFWPSSLYFMQLSVIQYWANEMKAKFAKITNFSDQIANFHFRRKSSKISVHLLFLCRQNFTSKVMNRNKILQHETKFSVVSMGLKTEIISFWKKLMSLRTQLTPLWKQNLSFKTQVIPSRKVMKLFYNVQLFALFWVLILSATIPQFLSLSFL